MNGYRFISFFLCTFLIFHDNASRAIPPLAMIGGMAKKNCSDPLDTGDYCWGDQLQATFLGVFYYGYALQMVSTYLAARLGFTRCVRLATFICGVVQLTVPVTVAFSPVLATIVQGLRGFVCGVFLSNNFDCARKWGLNDEAKLVISLTGIMAYSGAGIGPFAAGLLSKSVGWRYAFYLSGAVFLVALIFMCIFMPDDPMDAKFMSEKERQMFLKKKEIEESRIKPETEDKLSLKLIFKRKYLYCLSIYGICRTFLFFSISTMMPFYFNEVFGTDSEFLGYLFLALSLTTGVAIFLFSRLLPYLDARIPWLHCRVLMMVVPMFLRGICLALVPTTGNLTAAVVLLVIHNILTGTVYAGGILTVTFELDPINCTVIVGILNGIAQASGFIAPLVSAAFTSLDEGTVDYWKVREIRWRNFFWFNGGMSVVGVLSVGVALVLGREEWVKHSSLCVGESECQTGSAVVVTHSQVIKNNAATLK